jgi:hypothetical protein
VSTQENNHATRQFAGKSLSDSDLVAAQGQTSYDGLVAADGNDAGLWHAVGELLLLLRTRRGWNPIDVDRNGGPNYGTVQEHEKGQIRSTASLAKHAKALDVTAADVLRQVLATQEPLSAEESRVIRKFRATTVEGRAAVIALAQALPDATPEPPVIPPVAGRGSSPRTEERAKPTAPSVKPRPKGK